jgi:hypothetical protein
LSRAIQELAASRNLLTRLPGDSRASAELRQIQVKVRLAGRLLENAASYHFRWNRILGSMLTGYTSCGAAATVTHPACLVVEG